MNNESSHDCKKNIAVALAEVQRKLEPAIKDSKNPHLGNRYADLSSCWKALKDILPDAGLSISQVGEALSDGKFGLRTTLHHISGETISGILPLIITPQKGLNEMQVLGSAISYNRRYGIAAIVGLTTEDDDGESSGKKFDPNDGHKPAPKHGEPNEEVKSSPGVNRMDFIGDVKNGAIPNTFIVEVTIGDVKTKKGMSAKGEWSRTYTKADDGAYYSTFSEPMGQRMFDLSNRKVRLTYKIEHTEKGEQKTVLDIVDALDLANAIEEEKPDSDNLPF